MAQHTPGPWVVEDPIGANIGLWIVQDGLEAHQWSCIAAVTADHAEDRAHTFRFISESEQTANARLIAAAPDMLAQLKFVVEGCNDTNADPETILGIIRASSEAAIAKATGEV